MVFTAFSYLALAGALWIFLRLLQACFCLPRHLKKQNDVQQMLQDKVDDYERYILQCEEKEKTMILEGESTEEQNAEITKQWKERRECFEMMKRELKKVRDGGEINDWDYLLEEEQKLEEEEAKKKEKENENEEDVKITEIPEEKLSKREKKHVNNKKSSNKFNGSPKKSENVDLPFGKEEQEEENEKDEEETKKDK